MARFPMSKRPEDIEVGFLLPEDWYTVEITAEPELKPNRAKQNVNESLQKEEVPLDEDLEKSGYNINIKVATVDCPDPAFNRRMFTLYIPEPREGDEDRFNQRGQSFENMFLERKWKIFLAFHPSATLADEPEFNIGDRAQVYITQQKSFSGTDLQNAVEMNFIPRPVSEYEGFESSKESSKESSESGKKKKKEKVIDTDDIPFQSLYRFFCLNIKQKEPRGHNLEYRLTSGPEAQTEVQIWLWINPLEELQATQTGS